MLRGKVIFRLVAAAAALVAALSMAGVAFAQGPDVNHPMVPRGSSKPGIGANRPTRNLSYRGGLSGTGVEISPKVYLVFWGSQWSSDPQNEAPYLQSFLSGLHGTQDTWSTSTTQYCQNVASGTTDCTAVSGAQFVTHPDTLSLAGVWFDGASAAPTHPSQSQLAAEAVNAAVHFTNTISAANASVQYIIATAHGNSATGFGTSYCAWHSRTNSAYGNLAYTNLPYQPDAGGSCGQNFVNSGSAGTLDGVSIVAGHEYAETVTDQYPSYGWLDSNGAENGDKCAWISSGQGAAANITLGNNGTFAVQSLWSNNFKNSNGTLGNCVISYVDATHQQ